MFSIIVNVELLLFTFLHPLTLQAAEYKKTSFIDVPLKPGLFIDQFHLLSAEALEHSAKTHLEGR